MLVIEVEWGRIYKCAYIQSELLSDNTTGQFCHAIIIIFLNKYQPVEVQEANVTDHYLMQNLLSACIQLSTTPNRVAGLPCFGEVKLRL